MSLQTDRIFLDALMSNAELTAMLGAKDATATKEAVLPRIYNTAIPLPDEEADNVPVPYIILSFDALTNDQSTKDSFEGDTDQVQIGIEIAAVNRPQLGTLAELVRQTVREYFENIDPEDDDYELIPLDYQFSASAVQYDAQKPCYWQVLQYQCDTNL